MSRTIISGCGIAGATAACALKDFLPEEEIWLIDQETPGLYSRIRIPEVLAGKLPEDKLILTSAEKLREKGIMTLFGVRIESVDTAQKTVFYTGGSMKYDRFVFATGASPSLPPVPGLSQDMTLRGLDDLHRIEKQLKSGCKVLVVGGGLLGLEIAESVKAKGADVTVLEIAARLLPAILNEKESAWLKNYLEEAGMEIILSGKLESVANKDAGYQVFVNGASRDFDLVLVSAGIRPHTEIAQAAGIKTARGICVNERFETSAESVFAIGDCAELNGKIYGLWMASKGQGTALASILAGKMDRYEAPVFSPVPKLPGITLKALKEKAAEC
ncbi:MAG: FAD-dependent oxidoreductase [Lentisphaeria bacterium]|nr:FAD-dependent oxidoreductase [Lentisphaeria bacterium]